LEGRVRRVDTDNRLQPWEWLVLPGGRLMKTDALDHSAAHDLVGCQDIAWDVAGAVVEHGLAGQERSRLCAIVERESGHAVDPDLLRCLLPCYLAFQIGACRLASMAVGGGEAGRLDRSASRYCETLRDLLAGGC
jgi:hypothetical protein